MSLTSRSRDLVRQASYLNNVDKPGQYMFGNKKVSAKVQNGKLLIRVGGGWVTMEEYIKHYTDDWNPNPSGRRRSTKHLVREVGEGIRRNTKMKSLFSKPAEH